MEDWRRLGEYTTSARIAAGHSSRASFAGASGVSERTLDKLETGQRVSPSTLAAVEPHLGWGPGAARAVLDGGDPHPALAALSPEMRELAARIAALPPEMQKAAAAFVTAAEQVRKTTGRDGPGKT